MAIFINAEATKSLGGYFINRQSQSAKVKEARRARAREPKPQNQTKRTVQRQSQTWTQAPQIRRLIKWPLGLAGVDKTAIG